MDRVIHFKTIMMDSVPITGATSYKFFEECTDAADSITTLNEDQAIRWLLSNPHFANDFIREFIPAPTQYIVRQNLVYPFTAPDVRPGDIDLLFFPLQDPSLAIAIECKRVKIVSYENGTAKVNRAGEIDKGILQANAYRALGFHQTYLLVILLDDGRAKTTPNIMFRYTTGQPVDQIFNIPWREERHPDVGVIYIKINQMTGKHYNYSHSIGYCIDLPANPIQQATEMTNKIRNLIGLP